MTDSGSTGPAAHSPPYLQVSPSQTQPKLTHLIKQLQHDGEHIWVGFVYLIKEHHGIGALLQLLGQLATSSWPMYCLVGTR